MILGKRVEGKRIPLSKEYLMNSESVKGHIYEIVVKTKSIVDDYTAKKIASKLAYELPKKFNAELLYFENNGRYIVMDIKGSPFLWSEFLTWLPEVLILAGIIILTISVFLIIASNPWLAFATFIGVLLIGAGAYLLLFKEQEEEEKE